MIKTKIYNNDKPLIIFPALLIVGAFFCTSTLQAEILPDTAWNNKAL